MPPTALTKVISPSFGEGVVDSDFQAADQANTNSFANSGRTVIMITRAGSRVFPDGRHFRDNNRSSKNRFSQLHHSFHEPITPKSALSSAARTAS